MNQEPNSQSLNQETHKQSGFVQSARALFEKIFVEYTFFKKVFILFFTLVVFSWIFYQARANRSLLSYIGIMLMITMAYLEILIIRDYLWVLEGSLPEVRKWREKFFPKQSIRAQKFRKVIVIIFALGIFTYVFYRSKGMQIFPFMGIMLMLTVLYCEVLTIRDEVRSMMGCLKAAEIEKELIGEQHSDTRDITTDKESENTPTAEPEENGDKSAQVPNCTCDCDSEPPNGNLGSDDDGRETGGE